MPRATGRIHAANIEKSPRLQRFLAVLKNARMPLSTRTLQLSADCCNAHTCVAELRENGIPVHVERIGDLYFYSLIE